MNNVSPVLVLRWRTQQNDPEQLQGREKARLKKDQKRQRRCSRWAFLCFSIAGPNSLSLEVAASSEKDIIQYMLHNLYIIYNHYDSFDACSCCQNSSSVFNKYHILDAGSQLHKHTKHSLLITIAKPLHTKKVKTNYHVDIMLTSFGSWPSQMSVVFPQRHLFAAKERYVQDWIAAT